MKVFVAGATGGIGRPLIAELNRQGHRVTGMTRSEAGAQRLNQQGADAVLASAHDGAAVEAAIRKSQPDVVIDQLTSLPASPTEIASALPIDRKLRIEGGLNLLRAAEANGVRRYIQQSSGFFLAPGGGLADESVGFAVNASSGVSFSSKTYQELEVRLSQTALETVALRYGFFYGPNTWYRFDGACGDQVRRGEIPIIGEGDAVWSWVHIDDAAQATVAALTAPVGVYNIVDDDPSRVAVWLPAFARHMGAPPPPRVPIDVALETMGENAVYYGTKLGGASNDKAKSTWGFKPRRLEWLTL